MISKKIILLTFISVLVYTELNAQSVSDLMKKGKPKTIEEVSEVLQSGHIRFYYNKNWELVYPECATRFRICKINNELGTFDGKFVDYIVDSIPKKILEGYYQKGKKIGEFKYYHRNGNLAEKGYYINNKRLGTWNYYYKDGSKKQILIFNEDDILVKDFWLEDGTKSVDSLNGYWLGIEGSINEYKTSGMIVNGKRNGEWKKINTLHGNTLYKEIFDNGIMLKGEMYSFRIGKEKYRDTSYCYIEKGKAYETAEEFVTGYCLKDYEKQSSIKTSKSTYFEAEYPGGDEEFKRKLFEIYDFDGSCSSYGMLVFVLSIDKTGKLTNIKATTSIGCEFEFMRTIRRMGNWNPAKSNGKSVDSEKIIKINLLPT